MPRSPRLVAVLLYLHVAVSSAVLISGFWSIINERFDPHSAKRNLARISSFATLGGLLVLLLLSLLPEASLGSLVSIVSVLSLALFLLASRLQRAYAGQLARNLQSSEITPELVGALLDPEQPELVKLLLPGILAAEPSAAVVEGLARALHDESFEVRHRSARASWRRARTCGWARTWCTRRCSTSWPTIAALAAAASEPGARTGATRVPDDG